MIVCICNEITSAKLKEVIKTSDNFSHMLTQCCYKKQCGACDEALQKAWEESFLEREIEDDYYDNIDMDCLPDCAK